MGSCLSRGGRNKAKASEALEVGEIREEDLRGIFREFDLNGDGFIQRDELKAVMTKMGQSPTEEELTAMFNTADKDNDGNIDFTEFLTIARANPLSLSLRAVFDELDVDGDGHITRTERSRNVIFIFPSILIKERHVYQEEKFNFGSNQTFASIFTSEKSELRTAFQRMGHSLSDQEIKAIYKHVDVNHDGKINFHEFCNMMTRKK